MCLNPSTLPNGTVFGCRNCWQCREVRIQDWVGRCIAESRYARHTFSATFTYGGGDHERAAVLTYSDMQKYFKRLRKAGYRFKYLVAGEYGAQKGRAHWHAMLFFLGDAPPMEMYCNHKDKFWHHGHVQWKEPNPKSVRYVCKYIQKDVEDDERQGHFMMSKKPPIGTEYFLQMADDYVNAGLSPKDLKYRFADNVDRDGKPVPHLMRGAIADKFLERFVTRWVEKHGDALWPWSELVDDYMDSVVVEAPTLRLARVRYGCRPFWLPSKESKATFDEKCNTYRTAHEGDQYIWLKRDGEWKWLNAIGASLDRLGPQSHELSPGMQHLRETQRREQREQANRPAANSPPPPEPTRYKLPKRVKPTNLPMVGEVWVPR